jgi:segregation and condensation protein B
MTLSSSIESLLFLSNKPLSVKELADLAEAKTKDVAAALTALADEYQAQARGVIIIEHNGQYQMATAPENAALAAKFLKDETSGELSQPSLEALTIIAYRGPITKTELERLRGVNCSLILRNLMIRGLVEEQADKQKGDNFYSVTLDFLKFLGLSSVTALPDYEKLHDSETLAQALAEPEDLNL